jgi:hypothetical protein
MADYTPYPRGPIQDVTRRLFGLSPVSRAASADTPLAATAPSTRELGRGAVTHEPNDATSVFGKQRFEDCFTPVSQRCQRPRLVVLHKVAIANHIGSQDGSEAALGAFFGHAEQLF